MEVLDSWKKQDEFECHKVPGQGSSVHDHLSSCLKQIGDNMGRHDLLPPKECWSSIFPFRLEVSLSFNQRFPEPFGLCSVVR